MALVPAPTDAGAVVGAVVIVNQKTGLIPYLCPQAAERSVGRPNALSDEI